uniref:uncharacterized protein LOC122599659 n=1 Tax=Erigeron canadensis TaxID=72917 RepID=UPI001CB93DCB|nr:uncharacterized protein LOC122599659 [Erigeron canadensis]
MGPLHQYFAPQFATQTFGSAPIPRPYGLQNWGATTYQNALEFSLVGGSVENSPFIAWIQSYPLPTDLTYPLHLGTYKGKSDPDDFLEAFEGVAEMKAWNVPIACRMFRYALEGDAREWLKSVTKGSIVSFDDLKEKLRARLSQQKKHKKIHVAAHGIRQRETESCRSFIDRLTTETEDIVDLAESQRISGLIHGLWHKPLVEFLYRDLPNTYEQVQKRTHVFLDAREIASKGDNSPPHDKEASAKRGKWGNDREKPKYSPYQKEDRGFHKTILPELNKTPKEILLTESVLKKAIEEAISEGKLAHLVKSVRQQNPKKEDEQGEKKKGPEKTIYAILKKKPVEKRPLPKMYRGDVSNISFPSTYKVFRDPLVITALLEISKVKEIMVDTGSECNVLYEKAFWKLHHVSRMNLKRTEASVQGYSGETGNPMGKLSVKMTIGEGRWKRTKKICFLVVSGTSPFQAILRRPGIQKFEMIPSVIHGMIKYQSDRGIGTLVTKNKKLSEEGQDGPHYLTWSEGPYLGRMDGY